jgi:hypothetical protein
MKDHMVPSIGDAAGDKAIDLLLDRVRKPRPDLAALLENGFANMHEEGTQAKLQAALTPADCEYLLAEYQRAILDAVATTRPGPMVLPV